MKNIIYGLRDPRTDDYWYVGKSTQGLSRPKSHIKQSHNEAVNEWIAGLKADNLIPKIDILEECQNWNQLLDKEKFWISKLLNEDHPLLNVYEAHDIFTQREKIKALKEELIIKQKLLQKELKKLDQQVEILRQKNQFVVLEQDGLLKKFTPEIFGKEVQRYRKRLKLPRNKFADIAGLGKTVIYDIEHAKPSCRATTILKIAESLGIKLFLYIQT